MHLEALLIGNASCKLYIQNPRHPEISLVLIYTMSEKYHICVFGLCKIVTLYNLVINRTQYDFSHGHYAASERNRGLAGYVVSARRSSIKRNKREQYLSHL